MFRLVILSLVFLIALELFCRVYQYIIRRRTIKDSIYTPIYRKYYFLEFSFKPNSILHSQRYGNMKINNWGFRGPEFSLEKDDAIFRIICFGDSTSHSANYPAKLSEMLEHEKILNKKIEVINAAGPAWNTTQSLIQFITRGIYLKPDLIIVCNIIKDVDMTDFHWFRNLKQVEYNECGGFLKNNSQLYAFVCNKIEKLKNKFKYYQWESKKNKLKLTSNKAVSISNKSTQSFRMNLINFIAIAKFHGIEVFLCTLPLNYNSKESDYINATRAGFNYPDYKKEVLRVIQFNEILRELAVVYKLILVDLEKLELFNDSKNFVDLSHFTEQGAVLFADLIKQKLLQYYKNKN